jgi:hypothetical protein
VDSSWYHKGNWDTQEKEIQSIALNDDNILIKDSLDTIKFLYQELGSDHKIARLCDGTAYAVNPILVWKLVCRYARILPETWVKYPYFYQHTRAVWVKRRVREPDGLGT